MPLVNKQVVGRVSQNGQKVPQNGDCILRKMKLNWPVLFVYFISKFWIFLNMFYVILNISVVDKG
jgi:hypothetical protein